MHIFAVKHAESGQMCPCIFVCLDRQDEAAYVAMFEYVFLLMPFFIICIRIIYFSLLVFFLIYVIIYFSIYSIIINYFLIVTFLIY